MRNKKIDWNKVAKLYPNYTAKQIADKTGLARGTVSSIAKKLLLTKENPRLWKDKEIKYLLKYYEYGIAFVMEKLPKRSKWAIINKYRELTGKRE